MPAVTDRLIVAFCVVLAIGYFYATSTIQAPELGDPLGPRAFPILLGIALLIAAGLLLVEHLRRRGTATEEEAPIRWQPKVVFGVSAWLAIYYAVFTTLGYVIATTLFLLPLMAYFNRGRWVANASSAVIFSATSYGLFAVLGVQLPRGLLPF